MIIAHSISKSNHKWLKQKYKAKIFVASFFAMIALIFCQKLPKQSLLTQKHIKSRLIVALFGFLSQKLSSTILINKLIIMLDLKILIVYNSKRNIGM